MTELSPLLPMSPFDMLCHDMMETHRAKNTDYGSSWNTSKQFLDIPASQGIMVRMLDKIQRCCNLMKRKGQAEVKDEKLEDTLKDLAVYSLLAILVLKEEAGEKVAFVGEI